MKLFTKYQQNFEWFIFYGTTSRNLIWIRIYGLPYGIEIKKRSFKILKAKK